MPEWLKGVDCKSTDVSLHKFESYSAQAQIAERSCLFASSVSRNWKRVPSSVSLVELRSKPDRAG